MITKHKTNSSWWLGDDFFKGDEDILTGRILSDRTTQLIKLAGYRRAISNFVNIVTGKSNIPVRFEGGDSYTDGKTVTISASIKDKDFDSTVGLALHEGSHILLTDFEILSGLDRFIDDQTYSNMNMKYGINSYVYAKNYVNDKVKALLNIIEDRRIDNYIFKTAPGYKGYYHALYNRYFSASIIDTALKANSHRDLDWESYMFHICNITNVNRDLNALPGLLEIYKTIDLANISRLKSTKASLIVAVEIFNIIEANIPAVNESKSASADSNNNQADNAGDDSKTSDNQATTPGGEAKDDGSKAEGGDATTGTMQGEVKQLPELTPRQKRQLNVAIKKQTDFINNKIKKTKLNKTEQRKVQALDESGTEIKKVGKTVKHDKVRETECIVIKKLTQNVIDNAGYEFLNGNRWRASSTSLGDAVRRGVTLGRQLGKKLKLRSEERNTRFTRLDSGKIDKRLIGSLGYGAERIFHQVMNDKYTPANVHISVDASGSMAGASFTNCQTSVVAIAKAASMIDNLSVQISYRTTDGGVPVILLAYDSRVDSFKKITSLFKHICASALTPEGLAFEAIASELVAASGDKESYFINFSDGMPSCEPKRYVYSGVEALEHTRKQVEKMRSKGIKVLSYFISSGDRYNSYLLQSFTRMYGKSASTINITNVVPLAKTLNTMFLSK